MVCLVNAPFRARPGPRVCARICPILPREVGPSHCSLQRWNQVWRSGVASVQHSRYCFTVLVTFATSEAEELEEEESAVGCSCVKMAEPEATFDHTVQTEAIHSYAQEWVQALYTRAHKHY